MLEFDYIFSYVYSDSMKLLSFVKLRRDTSFSVILSALSSFVDGLLKICFAIVFVIKLSNDSVSIY